MQSKQSLVLGLGYVERDITEDLRGLLEPPQVRHRPGITDPARLVELLRAIDGYTGREVIGIALKLALLFFVRPGELRKARWRQFDLPAAQWRIPAECMKARVQHLVPLSRQALELLLKLRTTSGDGEYVFPLLRDPARPLHGAALSGALRSLAFDSTEVTPHGFRATGLHIAQRTWLALRSDRAADGSRCLRLHPPTLQPCATPS